MSIKAVGWAFDQITGSPISKLVLIKLADNANEHTGLCIPSLATIAKQSELSLRAVRVHINRLEKLGLLKIERQMVGNVHVSNRYHLALPGSERRAGVGHVVPGVRHVVPEGVGHDVPPNRNKEEPEVNRNSTADLLFESVQTIKNGAIIPAELDNPQFHEVWKEYRDYRKENKRRFGDFGPIAQKRHLNILIQRPQDAVALLNYAMDKQYRGIDFSMLDKQRQFIGNIQPKKRLNDDL